MLITAALPTPQFVIGLREGVEAALIVGIIATFLHQQGSRNALRWMWLGVALATSICVGAAIVLQIIDENLPQKQQEGFEALIGFVAVVMVTGMVFFMRKHAKTLKSELQASAGAAVAQGSAIGLVVMAFLAVMREGLETATFLLSTTQSSLGISPWSAAAGAVAGVLVAAVIGWAIYRGGMRLNMARFFEITAVVIVIIAAGVFSTSLKHLHEAGILNDFQKQAADLSFVITPDSGSVLNGLITGLLGIYPYPTYAEAIGWFAYAVPMLLLVLWPRRWTPRRSVTTTPAADSVSPATAHVPVPDDERSVAEPTTSS